MIFPMMLKAMSTTFRLVLLSKGSSLKVRPWSIRCFNVDGDFMYLRTK
jgi:hypothetical protein